MRRSVSAPNTATASKKYQVAPVTRAATAKKTSASAKPPARKTTVQEVEPSGYSPNVWGPHMWFVFHLVAATYPSSPTSEQKSNYAAFYKSLQHVLPCPGCRMGYQTIINSEPTKISTRTFGSRESLFKWTVDVHNRVNAKLSKPVFADWQAWYREYDKLR